jgi:phage replication-related protein YjqB (UPF0714/DUF867 family)
VADKYDNFEELSQNERAGIDFRFLARRSQRAFAIVGPHGGGIEPGTSEIADAIAGVEYSFYAFEGLKSKGNSDLHITSTHFNEPVCLTVIGESDVVVTIHGEHSDEDGDGVFVGGRDERLGRSIGRALKAAGFVVGKHTDPRLQGLEANNICNLGDSGKGVQLEISHAVREQMFRSLTREGRKHPTAKFRSFVAAIRGVLGKQVPRIIK